MDANKEKMLDRIAKLLQLAADQNGKPEGETAMAMASKLMAKHHIAESEVDFGNNNHSEVFDDDDGLEILNDQGGRRQWVLDITGMISYVFDCKNYYREWAGTVHFIGTENDIETCLYFAEVIVNHINAGARKMWPNDRNWKKRNIFGMAASIVVCQRLHEMKEMMDKEVKQHYSGGTDLVVVKQDLVEKAWSERSANFGKSKRKDISLDDKRTVLAGREAGRTAPLNRAIDN